MMAMNRGPTTATRFAHYEGLFAQGRRGALLDALALCAQTGSPMPPWLAEEWRRIYGDILTGRAVDLNDALGFNLKSPPRRNRRYIIASRGAEVGNAILLAHRRGRRIDDGLFKKIGKELGLSFTHIRACWRACKAEAERLGLSIELVDEFEGPIAPL